MAAVGSAPSQWREGPGWGLPASHFCLSYSATGCESFLPNATITTMPTTTHPPMMKGMILSGAAPGEVKTNTKMAVMSKVAKTGMTPCCRNLNCPRLPSNAIAPRCKGSSMRHLLPRTPILMRCPPMISWVTPLAITSACRIQARPTQSTRTMPNGVTISPAWHGGRAVSLALWQRSVTRSNSLFLPGTVASGHAVPTRSIPITSALSFTHDFCHSPG